MSRHVTHPVASRHRHVCLHPLLHLQRRAHRGSLQVPRREDHPPRRRRHQGRGQGWRRRPRLHPDGRRVRDHLAVFPEGPEGCARVFPRRVLGRRRRRVPVPAGVPAVHRQGGRHLRARHHARHALRDGPLVRVRGHQVPVRRLQQHAGGVRRHHRLRQVPRRPRRVHEHGGLRLLQARLRRAGRGPEGDLHLGRHARPAPRRDRDPGRARHRQGQLRVRCRRESCGRA
mmetsp:Transcript_3906/g.16617  ORF Transcript_3906/g.16617 Transcript_3906/m.16617 type:complete len:229 (-) Transcript_3906:1996-2682(-)